MHIYLEIIENLKPLIMLYFIYTISLIFIYLQAPTFQFENLN